MGGFDWEEFRKFKLYAEEFFERVGTKLSDEEVGASRKALDAGGAEFYYDDVPDDDDLRCVRSSWVRPEPLPWGSSWGQSPFSNSSDDRDPLRMSVDLSIYHRTTSDSSRRWAWGADWSGISIPPPPRAGLGLEAFFELQYEHVYWWGGGDTTSWTNLGLGSTMRATINNALFFGLTPPDTDVVPGVSLPRGTYDPASMQNHELGFVDFWNDTVRVSHPYDPRFFWDRSQGSRSGARYTFRYLSPGVVSQDFAFLNLLCGAFTALTTKVNDYYINFLPSAHWTVRRICYRWEERA
jgi:hypothetical protein